MLLKYLHSYFSFYNNQVQQKRKEKKQIKKIIIITMITIIIKTFIHRKVEEGRIVQLSIFMKTVLKKK